MSGVMPAAAGRRQLVRPLLAAMRRLGCTPNKYSATASEKTLCLVITKENFSKFLGQKRFSLEGGESLIPLLDHIVENALVGISSTCMCFGRTASGKTHTMQGDLRPSKPAAESPAGSRALRL